MSASRVLVEVVKAESSGRLRPEQKLMLTKFKRERLKGRRHMTMAEIFLDDGALLSAVAELRIAADCIAQAHAWAAEALAGSKP